jgi:phage tail sheath gpL-like
MQIGFQFIPSNILTPGVYAEFDPSRATKGVQTQPHEVLLVGQQTSAGSATSGAVSIPRSPDEAALLYGPTSQLYQMLKAYRAVDSLSPVSCIGLADNGSGVAATGSITWTGTATETSTQVFYVGGRRVPVAVPTGTTAAGLETLVTDAFALYPDMPVTVAADASTGVDFTAVQKGVNGNQIFLGLSLMPGERNVAGFTFTVTAMASGATEPSHAAAVTAMGEDQYHTIAIGTADSTEVARYVTELEDRWGPMRSIEGVAFVCKYDTQANLTSLGNAKNSQTLVIVGAEKSALELTPWETAAQVAADNALQCQIDPARATWGHILAGNMSAPKGSRFTRAERNTILSDGVATVFATSDGRMAIERLVTTYQTNSLSIADTAYQDLPRVRTLAAFRYALRNRIGTKFANFKLADDSAEATPAFTATPSMVKGEILVLFKEMQALGWVENYDQFKAELVVQRDPTDQNRINCLIPPDIINNLLVTAASIQFRK